MSDQETKADLVNEVYVLTIELAAIVNAPIMAYLLAGPIAFFVVTVFCLAGGAYVFSSHKLRVNRFWVAALCAVHFVPGAILAGYAFSRQDFDTVAIFLGASNFVIFLTAMPAVMRRSIA